MKRTTIFAEERLLKQVRAVARRKGVSVAEIVRDALTQYVTRPSDRDALPSVAGAFSSGLTDTSERVDQLLWSRPHE